MVTLKLLLIACGQDQAAEITAEKRSAIVWSIISGTHYIRITHAIRTSVFMSSTTLH